MAAFTALSYILVSTPLPPVSLATVLVSFTANMIGGLTPDIDQPTARLWHELPAGSIIGKIVAPLFGGHRFISHSLLGMFIAGVLAKLLLQAMSTVLLVDMHIVWWAFMVGFISHLFMDLFTHEGIPLFFPIPIKIGIPPLSLLRIKTGGIIEKAFVFPGLILMCVYLYYIHYHFVLEFFRHLK